MSDPEAIKGQNELLLRREELIRTYGEIEELAVQTIRSAAAVENPIITGSIRDKRYSISAIGLLHGPLDSFLEDAVSLLQEAEPTARFAKQGFRHITFREVNFNPEGRRAAGVGSSLARAYYHALYDSLSRIGKPVSLELFRIIPAIDREQSSVSLVAAFLPRELSIGLVRKIIFQAVESSGLPIPSRLGEIPVIFATVGRLGKPPRVEGNSVLLLNTLTKINSQISRGMTVEIENVDLISTTRLSYLWNDKHVYLSPPISLMQDQQKVFPRFITADQRLRLRA